MSRLALFAALLAWFVVGLGAYVRLSDAGLGCPDWPGCYGRLGAPSTAEQRAQARAAYPGRVVETHKAWKEMVHRYAAGTLGLFVVAIFVYNRRVPAERSRLPMALLALVAFQALLGRWTVTELLRPAIVTAHLVGGMTTLGMLVWLGVAVRPRGGDGYLRGWAALGLAVVAVQIALGGWTSSHHAAMVCGEGVSCRGDWLPSMDFTAAFSLGQAGTTSLDGLTAIHWSHRVGALIVTAVLAPLAIRLLRERRLRSLGIALLVSLSLQVGLGVANVVFALPLASAVLHNAVAALLLATMVVLNRTLITRGPQ